VSAKGADGIASVCLTKLTSSHKAWRPSSWKGVMSVRALRATIEGGGRGTKEERKAFSCRVVELFPSLDRARERELNPDMDNQPRLKLFLHSPGKSLWRRLYTLLLLVLSSSRCSTFLRQEALVLARHGRSLLSSFDRAEGNRDRTRRGI
jgi:hypothetical protein